MSAHIDVRPGTIAWVTLNRPEAGNALTHAMLYDLDRTLDALEADLSVKAIVLTGAGDDFCVGLDHGVAPAGDSLAAALAFQEEWARRMEFIFNLHKPTIAAINGNALGAGLDLALVCDLAFARDDAHLAVRGAHGDAASFALGTWFVGVKHTQRLVVLEEEISGTEAERIRLVNKALPREALMAEVTRYAEALSLPPGDGMALAKEAMHGVMAARGAPQAFHYAALLRASASARA